MQASHHYHHPKLYCILVTFTHLESSQVLLKIIHLGFVLELHWIVDYCDKKWNLYNAFLHGSGDTRAGKMVGNSTQFIYVVFFMFSIKVLSYSYTCLVFVAHHLAYSYTFLMLTAMLFVIFLAVMKVRLLFTVTAFLWYFWSQWLAPPFIHAMWIYGALTWGEITYSTPTQC